MEWTERLNKAIDYIEENLTSEIDYAKAAQIACCSTYHFQRMFAYMAGVPLSEYIRRRRMSLAAVDLQNGSEKIVDIALKYGYASPTAFNRAFQSVHGIAPSHVKQEGVSLRSYPPIRVQVMINGGGELRYRIEKRAAFRIIGISRPLQKEIEKNFEVVPQMWQEAAMGGVIPQLCARMDSQPNGILGVSACDDTMQEWQYFIAVSSTQPATEPFTEYHVAPFTWAVFPGEGVCPQAIQELERRVIMEWLPTSGYEYADGPDIELYLSPEPQNAKFEVWIPVTKATASEDD